MFFVARHAARRRLAPILHILIIFLIESLGVRSAFLRTSFVMASSYSRMAAPVLWNALDEATKVAERHLQEDAREWWLKMGHTAQVPAQVATLRGQLDQHAHLRVGTICEIGFNAGHSAVLWLEGTQARVIEFDLMALPYSHASRQYIEKRYPGRASFHIGDSDTTVAQHVERVRNGTVLPCDLWLIDGDHGIHARADFLHALGASRGGTIVIADDAGIRFPYVRKYWRSHVAIGSIVERGCTSTRAQGGAEKSWCVGVVSPWAAGTRGAAPLRARFEAAVAMSRQQRNAAYFQIRRNASRDPRE